MADEEIATFDSAPVEFRPQRKSLLLVASIVFVFYGAEIQIKSVEAAGVTATAGRPSFLECFLWVAFVYYFARFRHSFSWPHVWVAVRGSRTEWINGTRSRLLAPLTYRQLKAKAGDIANRALEDQQGKAIIHRRRIDYERTSWGVQCRAKLSFGVSAKNGGYASSEPEMFQRVTRLEANWIELLSFLIVVGWHRVGSEYLWPTAYAIFVVVYSFVANVDRLTVALLGRGWLS